MASTLGESAHEYWALIRRGSTRCRHGYRRRLLCASVSRYIVDLVEYDTSWPARFDDARRDVLNALGTVVVAIHHIGSTSVPGLPAVYLTGTSGMSRRAR